MDSNPPSSEELADGLPRPARARAERVTRAETDQRVALIGRLMAKGLWTQPKARQLAERYGVALRTVQDYATAASRLARSKDAADEIAVLKDATLGKYDRIYTAAMRLRQMPGSLQAAAMAVDKAAEISGIKAAQKHEVSVDGLAGLFASLDKRDAGSDDEPSETPGDVEE